LVLGLAQLLQQRVEILVLRRHVTGTGFRAVGGLCGLSTCWLGLGVSARLCRLAVWLSILLVFFRLLGRLPTLTGFFQLLQQRIEGLVLGLSRVLSHRACAPGKPNNQSEGREKRAIDNHDHSSPSSRFGLVRSRTRSARAPWSLASRSASPVC